MQLCMTCEVRRSAMMLAVCSGLRRLKVTMVMERRREKRAATTTIQIALAAAAAAAAAAAVLLTHPPQYPMPRHWLRPVHFSPLATKPSLPALLKRTWPVQSNHVQPHYFIERFVIFSPIPPFVTCRLKEFHDRTRASWEEKMRGEGSGGTGKELRKAVSQDSRHNLALMVVVLAIAR